MDSRRKGARKSLRLLLRRKKAAAKRDKRQKRDETATDAAMRHMDEGEVRVERRHKIVLDFISLSLCTATDTAMRLMDDGPVRVRRMAHLRRRSPRMYHFT